MSNDKQMCHARVTLQVEVVANSSWGPGTSMDQVYKQAKEDAEGVLRRLCEDRNNSIRDYKVLSIDAVIATRKS